MAQGRNRQPEGADAKVEVFAKLALRHRLFKIFVGSRHKTEIKGDLLGAPETGHFPFLQNPQKLGLQSQRQLAYFIEKHRATLRLLEDALVLSNGAGISALFVAKEHVLHKVLWNSATVQPDKWSAGTRRGLMNHSGKHFLA